jgi:hypothetical protein
MGLGITVLKFDSVLYTFHHWVDLIFWYKLEVRQRTLRICFIFAPLDKSDFLVQTGSEAEETDNLFYYLFFMRGLLILILYMIWKNDVLNIELQIWNLLKFQDFHTATSTDTNWSSTFDVNRI